MSTLVNGLCSSFKTAALHVSNLALSTRNDISAILFYKNIFILNKHKNKYLFINPTICQLKIL